MFKDFDEDGHFVGMIPDDAVSECTARGQDATASVNEWLDTLEFRVPRDQAIAYLREFGAWDAAELNAATDRELAERVFWIACGDIREHGHWHGLIH